MIKKYLLIIAVCLCACQEDTSVITYSPKPSDVGGTWESLSLYQYIPYAALKINSDGTGRVVLVTTENTTITATLSNFKTEEKTFLVTLSSNDPEDESELWQGSLIRGQLCFHMLDEDSLEIPEKNKYFSACFTRASEVENYRKVASEVLNG